MLQITVAAILFFVFMIFDIKRIKTCTFKQRKHGLGPFKGLQFTGSIIRTLYGTWTLEPGLVARKGSEHRWD